MIGVWLVKLDDRDLEWRAPRPKTIGILVTKNRRKYVHIIE